MIAIGCQVCGTELAATAPVCHRCGAVSRRLSGSGPAGHQDAGQAGWLGGEVAGPVTPRYPLKNKAAVLTGLLAGFAGATVAGFVIVEFDFLGVLLLLAIIPVFLVWLYRASRNAERSGCPQRRSAGWAIGGWFVPVIFLWFPYQVVCDIWRAGQVAERRGRVPWLVVAWWTCWLLTWVTGVEYTQTARSFRIGISWYSTPLNRLVITVTALLLIAVVRSVSKSPLGRPPDRGAAAGASTCPVAGPGVAWAPLPLPAGPGQHVPGPASGPGEPPPLPGPPAWAGNAAAPPAPTAGTSVPTGRAWRRLRSPRATVLMVVSLGAAAIVLTAVVAVSLATPAPAKRPSAGTTASATGTSAGGPPPAAPTTAPVRLSRDQRWADGLTRLQTRMNDAMGTGTTLVTPSLLRAQAKHLRRCTPELARLGPPTAELRPAYQQARQGCAGYDQAAHCYAAAASAYATSGPALTKFSRLLDCGDAGANKGSFLLSGAVVDSQYQTP